MNIDTLFFADLDIVDKYSILRFFGISERKIHSGITFSYIENEGQFPRKKKHLVLCGLTSQFSEHDSKNAALRELLDPQADYGLTGDDE